MLTVPTNKMTSSIINDVLGPIMRDPSSSHTAGSWRIAVYARALLGEEPTNMPIVLEDMGTYADVFEAQRADVAFAAGAMGIDMMDDAFNDIKKVAVQRGFSYSSSRVSLGGCSHPNELSLTLSGKNRTVNVRAQSTGGGTIRIKGVNGFAVDADSTFHDLYVQLESGRAAEAAAYLKKIAQRVTSSTELLPGEQPLFKGEVLLHAACLDLPSEDFLSGLAAFGAPFIGLAPALLHPKKGEAMFSSIREIVEYCRAQKCSFGEAMRRNEITLLGLASEEADRLMLDRLRVMLNSVTEGLVVNPKHLSMLPPTAARILEAEKAGKLMTGGVHLRAGARAVAAMQHNSAWGVVCAAPTAGSVGVLPGVVSTLLLDKKMSESEIVRVMWAAGGIGVIFNSLATFAAEVGGCQVEIAAAGAMATGMLLETAGCDAQQVLDGAAMYMQNNLGLVCDPVQGIPEVPCFSRNAVAAASAFFCSDFIQGGFYNLVPFDETLAAVMNVSGMLPRELRCTALGGIAITPSGLNAVPNVRT